MDAKSRKVLNLLKKAGVEQDAFDLSIAVGVDEDAVRGLLASLSSEGLVSCRRDGSGKEFWSVAAAGASGGASGGAGAADTKGAAAGRKKGRATAGPDDRFEELIAEPSVAPVGAASPIPTPPPIQAGPEVEDFEFAPRTAAPGAAGVPGPGAAGTPGPGGPEPKREGTTRMRKVDAGPSDNFEPGAAKRPKREQSAGADDRFDEFAEKVPAKPKLPVQLMAWAATLVLMLILFILSSSSGGKAKRVQKEFEGVKVDLQNKIDSLRNETKDEIAKLRKDNKNLKDAIDAMKADMKKPAAAAPAPEAPPAAANTKNDKKSKKGNKK